MTETLLQTSNFKPQTKNRLILASSSPRRLELLSNMNMKPDELIAADIDESVKRGESPQVYVHRLAKEKALKVIEELKSKNEFSASDFVVAADTTVAIGKRIIGKAEDELEARKILMSMSGKKHKVFTGFYVENGHGKFAHKTVMTEVKFKRITGSELDYFISTNEWVGKAGAYTLQKDPCGWVISIHGSFSNVIGLPQYEVKNALIGLGYQK